MENTENINERETASIENPVKKEVIREKQEQVVRMFLHYVCCLDKGASDDPQYLWGLVTVYERPV